MRDLVICVGLPKTGTLTLATALEQLGYKNVKHNPHGLKQRWFRGDYTIPQDVGAVVNGAEWIFPGLLEAHPDAKVIYLYRDRATWLKSVKRQMDKMSDSVLQGPPYSMQAAIRLDAIHMLRYEENHFCEMHRLHAHYVKDYFERTHRTQLAWNLTKNPEWAPLCRFLGKVRPQVPFPHRNKGRG